MFQIIEGDLFDSTETYLCHQTNCVTKRAAHLAAAVFDKYPYADIYSPRKGMDKPGTIVIKGDNVTQRYVINMLGQFYPGFPNYPTGKLDGHASRLKYFCACLKEMTNLKGSFAFPYTMGCGAAGGDWERYLAGLKWFESQINGDVIIYKLPGAK